MHCRHFISTWHSSYKLRRRVFALRLRRRKSIQIQARSGPELSTLARYWQSLWQFDVQRGYGRILLLFLMETVCYTPPPEVWNPGDCITQKQTGSASRNDAGCWYHAPLVAALRRQTKSLGRGKLPQHFLHRFMRDEGKTFRCTNGDASCR